MTKQSKQHSAKPTKHKPLMRENQKLTSIRNRGIDRRNVLSSGRALPSSHGWQHLATQCELQFYYLQKAIKHRDDTEERNRQRIERLNGSHKRDNSRLDEVPNRYLLPQKILAANQAVKAATELMEALQRQYKRATGSNWKPKPNVNEPIK